MTSSELFITGCDHTTEWMLPWFVENFRKHNPYAELMIFDFGMNTSQFSEIRKSHRTQDKGWFKKPSAMLKAAEYGKNVCWLDTDCEVVGGLDGIWKYVGPNKIGMVEDKPWSARRGEKWHNSGVVAFSGKPTILQKWASEVAIRPEVGDQEVLHSMMTDPLKRMTHIDDVPNQYNVLRLQVIDKTVPPDPVVYHWTGRKGKDIIREKMK